MTAEQAREVLASEPPCEESLGAIRKWSDRYAEAWMVQSGNLPEQIKAAMEHLTGRRLD
jgi:hypothetical protein